MPIFDIPASDDAYYINEPKNQIFNEIAEAINQTGLVTVITKVPAASEIVGATVIETNPSNNVNWSLPSLSGVLPSGASTTVHFFNISVNTVTFSSGSGSNVNTSQYSNTINSTTDICRTYLVVQDGTTTEYYPVA